MAYYHNTMYCICIGTKYSRVNVPIAATASAAAAVCGAACWSNEACISLAEPVEGSLGRERSVFCNRHKTAIRLKTAAIRHKQR